MLHLRLMVQTMPENTKEKNEKERALKKLINKWRAAQETKRKASILLARNPEWKKIHKLRP